jgi:hypothetical protein
VLSGRLWRSVFAASWGYRRCRLPPSRHAAWPKNPRGRYTIIRRLVGGLPAGCPALGAARRPLARYVSAVPRCGHRAGPRGFRAVRRAGPRCVPSWESCRRSACARPRSDFPSCRVTGRRPLAPSPRCPPVSLREGPAKRGLGPADRARNARISFQLPPHLPPHPQKCPFFLGIPGVRRRT